MLLATREIYNNVQCKDWAHNDRNFNNVIVTTFYINKKWFIINLKFQTSKDIPLTPWCHRMQLASAKKNFKQLGRFGMELDHCYPSFM